MSYYKTNLATKLYIQLAPSQVGLDELVTLSESVMLHGSGRSVPRAELHLTILHIGALAKLFDSIQLVQPKFSCNQSSVQSMISELELVLAKTKYESFTLSANKIDVLGKRKNTLVVRFKSDEYIESLHSECLSILQKFLLSVGVDDVQHFMKADHNLLYALSVVPHVTIVKSYTGPTKFELPFETMVFKPMKVVY